MFLTIVVVLGALASCAFGILLLAPVHILLSGTCDETESRPVFYLSWFHPLVLRCDLGGKSQLFSTIALNRFHLFASGKDMPPQSDSSSDGATPDYSQEETPNIQKSAGPQTEERASFGHRTPDTKQRPEETGDKPKTERIDKSPEPAPQGQGEKPKKRIFGFLDSPPLKRVLVFLRSASWRRKILRWLQSSIARFFHIVSVSQFRLSIRFGLSDPGQTGQAYGYFIAAKYALLGSANSKKEILVEPVFDQELMEVTYKIRILTSFARLCLPVILAVMTFPYIHTLALYLQVRRIKG